MRLAVFLGMQLIIYVGTCGLLWYSVEFDRAIADAGGTLAFASNPMRIGILLFCLAGFIINPLLLRRGALQNLPRNSANGAKHAAVSESVQKSPTVTESTDENAP